MIDDFPELDERDRSENHSGERASTTGSGEEMMNDDFAENQR